MGALENFISDSHDVKISASQERGQDRAKKLKKLPKKTRKAWLGKNKGGPKVSRLDEAMGAMNEMSGEDMATRVPLTTSRRRAARRRSRRPTRR